MHRRSPFGDEENSVFETDGTGGGERGVLAEAVSGAERGLDAETFDGVENHQARDVGRHLSVASVTQLFGVCIEKESTDVSTGDVGGFGDEFPTFVVDPGATHTGPLGALAGERECEHR